MTAQGAEPPEGAPFLSVEGLEKSFGDQRVLRGIDLDVDAGEVLALLGPSGSGKSTLLRVIGGFETADVGTVRLEGRDITGQAPRHRPLSMVFQSYALFPHLSVEDNVAFGLHRQPASERRRRVEELLQLVQLQGLGGRAVDQISGGQQQRVALARALAPNPSMLLLDEPLSNLDPSLRETTRDQLLAIIRRVGITTILVTHEQEEAFALGDRVAVLSEGRLEQVAKPVDLYHRPATPFVARFIGRSNWFASTCEVQGDRVRVVAEGWSGPIELDIGRVDPECLETGAAASLWIRPESLRFRSEQAESEGPSVQSATWEGAVARSRWIGPHALVELENDGGERIEVMSGKILEVGDRVAVSLSEHGQDPARAAPRVFPAPTA